MKIFSPRILTIIFFLLFMSSISLGQWVRMPFPDSTWSTIIRGLVVSNSKLFAGTNGSGVFLSTDYGLSWTTVNNGLPGLDVSTLYSSGGNLYVGIYNHGAFLSTNNGSSWTSIGDGLTSTQIEAFEFQVTNLFAATLYGEGIYRSTNNGTNWTVVNNGLTTNQILSIAAKDSYIFAGSDGAGIFRSTNNGTNWSLINNGLTGTLKFQDLEVIEDNIFAGSNTGPFLSTNNGSSWMDITNDLTEPYVQCFIHTGINLFLGNGNGVFLTTNFGTNWTSVNGNSTNLSCRSLTVSDIYIFVGGSNGWIWRRPLSEMITLIEEESDTPYEFNLKQNFPNPFNPRTSIQYAIGSLPDGKAGRQFVSIKVYDLLGREIVTLVNEEKPVGEYEVEFNAAGLPSGIYFYQLRAGNFSETKKMVLIR